MGAKKDRSNRKYIYGVLFFAVLFVITFFMLFDDKDMFSLLPQIMSANTVYVALGFLFMFGYICCEAVNIYILNSSLHERPKFAHCLKYAFVGFYFSSITPSSSGGQPAQIYYMKRDGIKIGHSTVNFLIMLMSLQIVTLIFALISLVGNGMFVFSNMDGIWPLFVYGIIFYTVMIFVIVCAVFYSALLKKIVKALVTFLAAIKIIKNKEEALKRADESIESYIISAVYIKKNPHVLIKTLGVSTVQVLLQFSVPYLVYRAFGQDVYSYFDIFSLQTILTICVSTLPLPGAVGASEGTFMKMFFVIFGSELVLPATLLNRGISFYVYLIISGIVSAYAHYKAMKKQS